MATVTIRDIPVTFPFKPYDIQKNYMEKVIECLQNETNGVLESPTGTGKTLSLLCSSLAWLTVKKAQIQAQRFQPMMEEGDPFLIALNKDIDQKVGNVTQASKAFYGVPTIIYASRTHSQLSQAMQELKRTAYGHLKATIVGSREQLCINEEVKKEDNNTAKIHMCRLKVTTRTCFYYNKVEKFKDDPMIKEVSVMDIEDLVKAGEKHKFCPYFMAKEIKQQADIVFMPYNYILDMRARKALGIELSNTVIILDEAHNVDKMCEESASVELKSSDITLCIEEVTGVMKAMSSDSVDFHDDSPKDFTADELCILKQVLLDFEKAIDSIQLTGSASEGTTLEGDYIFEIFKMAKVNHENAGVFEHMIDKIIQFLATVVPDGPFQRKGNGLELFESLVKIVFANPQQEYREKIKKCYKVHVIVEELKKKWGGGNDWLSKASSSKKNGRVLSFWCFSAGFGMSNLMTMGVKSVILTSGTLAPLAPLITELQLTVPVRLENPHIVTSSQICVKIVTKGPDGVELNSSFQNRNSPQYISSLGRTILNLTRIIPNGLLIFFPSYPIMLKCQQEWQMEGIWTNICDQKAIYVEPKQKEAFNLAMIEYYNRINNPQYKGAIFMGVCRGKVSEGLDFADMNGRAVIITGLPYPPFMDPKIVLKRKYINECRLTDKAYLTGDEWYALEASRAVNQAIGRVIRHQNDYGAIILLDSRFTGFRIKSQLSLWLREHIRQVNNFGEIIRDLRNFFKNAEINFPVTKVKVVKTEAVKFDTSEVYGKRGNFDFSTSSSVNGSCGGLVEIHETGRKRRRRIKLVDGGQTSGEQSCKSDIKEYIVAVKKALNTEDFKAFLAAVTFYRDASDLDEFILKLDSIFLHQYNLRYVIQGLEPFIKASHRVKFNEYWEKMR